MRRFLQLATILLVAVVATGTLHATQVAAVPSIVSNPSLFCFLPQCDGPYCRGRSNGCLVCCTH